MLDRDLAELYGVETRTLVQAVKRNIERFPEDFMFQATKKEFDDLIFQNGISSWGGTRKLPYAFTEQRVAMLSSVLKSKRAIMVNIQIMRAFTRLRRILASHEELRRKIEEHDTQIQAIFEAIRQLMTPSTKEQKKIGFRKGED